MAALLILAFAAAPGYAGLRAMERRSPRDAVSPVRETLEIVSLGLTASAITALLLLFAAQLTSALLPLRGLIVGPGYFRAHPWQLILSGLLQIVLATGLAAAMGMLVVRRFAPVVIRQGNLWHPVLAENRDGRRAYVAIELLDGRLVEGFVLMCSTAVNPGDREIALQGPLAVTASGGARTRSPATTIVLSGAQIRMMTVSFPELRHRAKVIEGDDG
ncbi:DUF6338 family protein [Micromonospora sp. DT62]|uniref:DUF6338 family protein n=1 Tax=Micromonospora sp. DT62 TaxID=3416521 RepID=UPI003CEBD6E2